MGGQMNEQKVCIYQKTETFSIGIFGVFFQKPTIENLDQAEEEFTLARLYLSKLKTEARSITGVCYFYYLN